MRALLWISVTSMALCAGYWFMGKTTVERTVAAGLAAAPAQGFEVSHAGYGLRGYPNRFDLTFDQPKVTDTRSGLSWQGAFLQIFSLSYRPWHVIAAFPPQQVLSAGGQALTLDSDKLQASVVVSPDLSLTLDRTTLIGEGLRATHAGETLTAKELRFASRANPAVANAHDIGLEITELRPSTALSADMPTEIARIRLDGLAALSAPIDRNFGQTRPELTSFELREALVAWGEASLFAKGTLAVKAGVPEGTLELRLTGWRQLMPVMQAMTGMSDDQRLTAERMLNLLANNSGDANVVTLPLIFTNGQMRLGPVGLGPVPFRLAP